MRELESKGSRVTPASVPKGTGFGRDCQKRYTHENVVMRPMLAPPNRTIPRTITARSMNDAKKT